MLVYWLIEWLLAILAFYPGFSFSRKNVRDVVEHKTNCCQNRLYDLGKLSDKNDAPVVREAVSALSTVHLV